MQFLRSQQQLRRWLHSTGTISPTFRRSANILEVYESWSLKFCQHLEVIFRLFNLINRDSIGILESITKGRDDYNHRNRKTDKNKSYQLKEKLLKSLTVR